MGMDVFCLLLDCLFFCFAFGCGWLLFSVCSLFGLPFVLLCFLSVYPFLSLSRYVPYPFRSMACKKRRGTQVQIASRIDPPPPARPARYRSDGRPRIISDIGRSHGRPSIPPGGLIWSIWFGTGLAVRRRISSLGPISGPNDPIWSVSDIGFDGWKFPISEP